MTPKQDEGFRGVSLMKELLDAVEYFIEKYPAAGYKSKAEFVQDAVRRRIEEVKKIYASSSSIEYE